MPGLLFDQAIFCIKSDWRLGKNQFSKDKARVGHIHVNKIKTTAHFVHLHIYLSCDY